MRSTTTRSRRDPGPEPDQRERHQWSGRDPAPDRGNLHTQRAPRCERATRPHRQLHRRDRVAVVIAFGVQYERAGDQLAYHQDPLGAAEAGLAEEEAAVLRVHATTELSERARSGRHAPRSRTAECHRVDGCTHRSDHGQDRHDPAAIKDADTARFLVAANRAWRRLPSTASRRPSPRIAPAMTGGGRRVRGANEPCARTLAYTTGAGFPYDFADPFVLRAGGTYYAYSTNSGAGDLQVIRSSDLVVWDLFGNALPALPGWARGGATWAPAVLARNGAYVLYYTAGACFGPAMHLHRGVGAAELVRSSTTRAGRWCATPAARSTPVPSSTQTGERSSSGSRRPCRRRRPFSGRSNSPVTDAR